MFSIGVHGIGLDAFCFLRQAEQKWYTTYAIMTAFMYSTDTEQNLTEVKKSDSESLQTEGDIRERREELEAAIAVRYEDFLLEHDPVNAGNDGLIYRMTIEEMADDLKKALAEEGVEVEGTSAVKLLKVYNPGKARQEYRMQQRAYELTEAGAAAGEKVARVPRPIECRAFSIQESTRKILNSRGANLTGNQVEIVTMDFIPGKDITDIVNRWVYDHAPREYQSLCDTINPDNHLELMKAVAIILKFNQMPRGTPEENLEVAERREKTLRFLEKTRFRIADSVIEKISNTRRIIEGGGVYHNDDHERNFMVVGDITGQAGEPEVYEIDFGRAGDRPVDEIRFYLERHLAPLTERHKATEAQQAQTERQKLNERIRSLASSKEQKKLQLDVLRAAINSGNLETTLVIRGVSAAATEASFEQFLGLLAGMVGEGHLNSKQAENVVVGIKQGLVGTRQSRGKTVTEIKNPYMYKAMDRYRELFQ